MRVTLTLIFGFLMMNIHINAQDAIELNKTMSLGPQNCFYIEIEGADEKLADKTFTDFVKEYGKLKTNKKAKEKYLMDTKIPIINGTSPVSLYAQFEQNKGQATTYVWVDLGGAFVNSNDYEVQANGMRQFLYDYWVDVRKKVVAEELKSEQKTLSNLEKDLKNLEKENDSYHKDIQKAEQQIAKAESGIEKNLTDQDNKNSEIKNQKQVIEGVIEKLNNIGKRD